VQPGRDPSSAATRTAARRILVAAAGTVLMVGGVVAWVLHHPDGGPAALPAGNRVADVLVGRPAPALAGTSLAGSSLDLAAERGSVVVVTAWAAWCAPCRSEIDTLVALQRREAGRGLRLVGIDVRDGARQAEDLLAAGGGDPGLSLADPAGSTAAAWGVRDLPQTFVVDRAGTVRAHRFGAVTDAWLSGTVGPLLSRGVDGGAAP
jgi:cytochrome c biogenesis protein CcmG, thiol:disulfide interchange protein DsbE